MVNQPPKVARWLLSHFGCSPNNDAVIGDLDERYQQGRSPVWYWRQACTAILVTFWSDVHNHKLLTVRAIVMGWLTCFTGVALFLPIMSEIRFLLLATLGSSAMWGPSGFGDLNRTFHIQERFFRLQTPWAVMVSIFITILVVVYAGAGALIARFHRPHERAMTLAFIVSQIILLALTYPHSGNLGNLLSSIAGVIGTVWGAGFLSGKSNRPKLNGA
jgi:hypothetical protein